MGNVYQVLLIEDDESDADLIRTELGKLDIEVQVDLITQEQKLQDRLANNPPDLVISDYNLTSFNAIEALKIVRQKDPYLPFILISGNIGEEKAVDAMLEGASDYAMKSNLDRLGPAIMREFKNYEEQQEKTRQLARTRERYQLLIQSVDGIVWEADAENFEFYYVSTQSAKLLGYSPDEWISQPDFWKSHIHPEDRSRVINFCKKKTRQGENHRFEYRMISADQEVVWLRDYVTVVTKQDEPDRLRGFMVDITNEKKAEKQRDKAYQIADIGHWELDLVHQQLHWSDTVKRLHEVPLDYEPDLDTAITFYKEGEHRQTITELVERTIETGQSFDVELKIITAKGNERWIRAVGETEYRQGECQRIYGSTQDITQRKEAEQKLRDVVEHSTNMFYRHNTDHVLTYLSPQSEQFLGCTPEEAKQRWMEFVTDHPINKEGIRHTQKAIETGQAQPAFPLQLQKKNGEVIWVRVNEAPVTENGQTVAIVGSLTDVTEQKKYEQKLQESLERYDYATRATSDAIWDWNLQEDTIFWGQVFETLFGYNRVSMPDDSCSWTNHIHPNDKDWVYRSIRETIEGDQQNWSEEYRYMKADGSFAYVEDRGFVIRDDNGEAIRMIGAMRDVTDEKREKIQNQLRQDIASYFKVGKNLDNIMEEVLQHLVEFGDFNTGEAWLTGQQSRHQNLASTYAKDEKGEQFYNNSRQTTTFSRGEGLPGSVWQSEKLLVWNDIDTSNSFIRRRAAQQVGLRSAVGIPLFHNDNMVGVLVFGSENKIDNDQNILTFLEGLQHYLGGEIQRKKQEQELRLLFESAPEILAITGPDKQFIRVNPAFCNLLGYSEEELTSQCYEKFIHPEDLGGTQEEYRETISGQRQADNYVNRWRTKSGEYRWLSWSSSQVFGEDGFVFAYARDITKQKRLEDLLQQTNRLARVGSWELVFPENEDDDDMYWSEMTREILEVNDDYNPTLTGGFEFYEPESKKRIQEAVEKAIDEGTPFDEELLITTAKGNKRWVRCIGNAEFEEGICIRIYGSYQDIHDRKEAEQKLQHVANNIPGAIFQYRLYPDGSDELMYLSKGAQELWGLSPKKGMQNNRLIWDQIPEEDYRQVQQSIVESAETMTPWNTQWRSHHPDRGLRWHEGNGIPRELPDGSTVWDSIILDITEQKQAEEQITETNKKLKMAQEIASLGYWELELETGEVYWSEQSYKIWELDPEEVTLTKDLVFERMHPDDREHFREQHEQTMETKQPLDLEHRILLPDGTVKWIHVLGDLKTSAEGQPVAIEGTAQDITGEKEAQIQLEKAYKENETILESIGDAFFAVDENWIVTYWNKEAEQVLGKPKEEIVGKNLWEEYEDAVDLAFYTQYHKAVNENVSVSFEEYYPGAEKWFEVSAYPSKTGLSVYFRDVTERRRNEKKIRQIKERFEKVTEATNDAIWDFDASEGELFWGRGFEFLFGYDLDETNPTLEFLIGQIHPEDRGEIVQKIEEYMQPGPKTDWYQEYRFKKADGTYAPVMDRAIFVRNNKDEVTRVVGAMTDLTRQKKNEEALKDLNRELEKHAEELAASNAELEQFAYVASHDLQEPLRMVSSFLERLENKYGSQLDDKARQYINFAVDGAGRMRQIILDLLNYSRVGQHEFEREQICLDELLEEILKLEQRAIWESEADITWEGLPEIEAAQTPMQQVFQNLIGNALKYRKPGTSPVIRIRGEETDTHWKFSVSDNGIGIRDEFQENIFTIFQRLHTQEEYAGTGIGLAVSKKIVEKHGGSIWVESEEGKGSTFYFTIGKEL